MEQPKVSIGVTSIVGWAGAVLALLPTIVKSIEEGQVAFNGPEKYLAITGIALALVTNIGRYLQAHKLIETMAPSTQFWAPSAQTAPEGFESGSPNIVLKPESAAKPDGPSNAGAVAVQTTTGA